MHKARYDADYPWREFKSHDRKTYPIMGAQILAMLRDTVIVDGQKVHFYAYAWRIIDGFYLPLYKRKISLDRVLSWKKTHKYLEREE